MSWLLLTKQGTCLVKSGIDGIVPELYEDFSQDLEIVSEGGYRKDGYSTMVLWSNSAVAKINFCSSQVVEDKKNNTYIVVSKKGLIDEDNEYEKNTYKSLAAAVTRYKSTFCVVPNFNLVTFKPEEAEDEEDIIMHDGNYFEFRKHHSVPLLEADVKNRDDKYTQYEFLSEPNKKFLQLIFKHPDSFHGKNLLKAMIKNLGFPTKFSLDFALKYLIYNEFPTKDIEGQKNISLKYKRIVEMIVPFCIKEIDPIPSNGLMTIVKSVRERVADLRFVDQIVDSSPVTYAKIVDVYLGQLKYKILPMKTEKKIVDLVRKSVSNVKMHLIHNFVNIYSFDTSVTENEGKKFLLWHGTKKHNISNILKTGLNKSDKERLFGAGVYHTDALDKAIYYCDYSDDIILLLNEVHLGVTKEISQVSNFVKSVPEGYDSVKGLGELHPDPDQIGCDEYGAEFFYGGMMPFGGNTELDTYLKYNEFVVYEKKQVVLRYLVHLKLIR